MQSMNRKREKQKKKEKKSDKNKNKTELNRETCSASYYPGSEGKVVAFSTGLFTLFFSSSFWWLIPCMHLLLSDFCFIPPQILLSDETFSSRFIFRKLIIKATLPSGFCRVNFLAIFQLYIYICFPLSQNASPKLFL